MCELPNINTMHIGNLRGRLGNQLGYIAFAIYIANFLKINQLIIPKMYIGSQILVNSFTISFNNNSSTEDINFYDYLKNGRIWTYKTYQFYIANIPRTDVKKLFQKYFLPHVKVNLYDKPTIKNCLYIHIRAGDNFNQLNNGLQGWLQPPLDYYLKIIKNNDYDNVMVVYENELNPCVKGLMNANLQNITFQSSTLLNDVSMLLSAEHLVVGKGTFCQNAIYYLSKNLKKIYAPADYFTKSWGKNVHREFWGCDLILINFPNYIDPRTWRNTLEQRNIMLNYKIEYP